MNVALQLGYRSLMLRAVLLVAPGVPGGMAAPWARQGGAKDMDAATHGTVG